MAAPSIRRRERLVAVLLTLPGLAAGCSTEPPNPRAELLQRVAGAGLRPTPGRLIGELPARPGDGYDAGAVRAAWQRLDAATRKAAGAVHRQGAADAAPATAIADSALIEVFSGRLDEAIARLERAASLDPGGPATNDLAAAYLARAQRESRVLDRVHALEAARRAVTLHPSSPEAAFNYALALTRLHLLKVASKAWRHFLLLEPAGPWAGEAKEHLARLEDGSHGAGWQDVRRRLLGEAALGADPGAWAERYPHEIRELFDRELLPAWARAIVEGRAGAARLGFDRAAEVAEALAAVGTGDLPRDEIRSLRALAASAPEPQPPLVRRARAILAFHEGMAAYARHEFSSSYATLRESARALEELGSPYRLAAELYRAISQHYGDLPGAESRLEELLAVLPPAYRTLRGRTWWMLGTIASARRQFEQASRAYLEARALVERSAGPVRAASIDLLLADNFDRRGEVVRGWKYRLAALEGLAHGGEPRRKYGVAFEAAQALARHDRTDLALLFLDEALAALDDYGVAAAGAEIHLERARILVRRGERARVGEELRAADGYLGRVEESGLTRRLRAVRGWVEGMASLGADPGAAADRIRESLAVHRQAGYRFDELVYLSALAEAQRLSNDPEGAVRTLTQAVEAYEEARRQAGETVSQVDSFRHAEEVFDQLMSLALEARDPIQSQAFAWSERGRARTILSRWSGGADPSKSDAASRLEDLSRRLRPGTVLLEYAVVDERVVCWVLSRRGSRYRLLSIPAGELRREAAIYVKALEGGARETSLRERGRLFYRELVAPLDLDLREGMRLVVVPDGPLRELPFAAFVDAADRYLIETVAVSYAPSAELHVLAAKRQRRFWAPLAPLVVGNPGAGSGPYGELPRLALAEAEVRAISARFPGSRVLFGEHATPVSVRESLPDSAIFHFTGHAISSAGDWGASALVLSPAGSGDDGLLRVADLLEKPLGEVRLATLAACATLDGYHGGREGTVGLALAFFAAGVPSVLGSLWDVEDASTLELMELFYQELTEAGTPADALRKAVLEVLERNGSHRSPARWGAFAVLGI